MGGAIDGQYGGTAVLERRATASPRSTLDEGGTFAPRDTVYTPYVRYYDQGWRNKPDTLTPITADALDHVEDGLVALAARVLTAVANLDGTFNLSDQADLFSSVLTRQAADALYDKPTAIVTGGATPGTSDATAEIFAAVAKVRTAGGGRILLLNPAVFRGTAAQCKANNQGLRGAIAMLGVSNVHVSGAHPGVDLIMDNLNAGNGATHGIYFVGGCENVGVHNMGVVWKTRPNGRGLGDGIRFLGFPGMASDGRGLTPDDSTWGWAAWSTPVLGVVITVPAGVTSMQLSVGINGGAAQTTAAIGTLTAAGIQSAIEALPNVGVGKVTVTASPIAGTGIFRAVFTKTPAVTVAANTGGTVTTTPGVAGFSTGTVNKPFLHNTRVKDAPGVGVIFMGCANILSNQHTTTDTFADGHHQNACRGGSIVGYHYLNTHKGHGNGDDSFPFVTYYDPIAPASSPEGPFNQPSLGDWSNTGIASTGFSLRGGRASGIRVTGSWKLNFGIGYIEGKGVGLMVNGTLSTYVLNTSAATAPFSLDITDVFGVVWNTGAISDWSVNGISNAIASIGYINSTDNVTVTDLGGGKFQIALDPDLAGGGNITIHAPANGATLANTNDWTTSASQAIQFIGIDVDNCSTGVSVQTNQDTTGTAAFYQFDVDFKKINVTRSKTIPWNLLATGGTATSSIYGIRIEDCTGDVDALLGCVGSNLTLMRGHIRGFTQRCLNGSHEDLTIQGQPVAAAFATQMQHRLLLEDVWVTDGGALTIKNVNDLTLLGRAGSRNAWTNGVSVTNVQTIRGEGQLHSLFHNRNNANNKTAAGVILNRLKNHSSELRCVVETDANATASTYNSLLIGSASGGVGADPALENVVVRLDYRTTMDPATHNTDDVTVQGGLFTDGLPMVREYVLRPRTMHRGGTGAPAWVQGDYCNTSATIGNLVCTGAPTSSRLTAGPGSSVVDKSSNTPYTAPSLGTWSTLSYAPLASPAFTGNPTAPTQSQVDVSTRIATTAFVSTAVTNEATARAAADALKAPLGTKFAAASATNTTTDTTLATSASIPAASLSTATTLRINLNGNIDGIATSGAFNVKIKVNGISLGSFVVAASQTALGSALSWNMLGEIYVDATGASGSVIYQGTRNSRSAAGAVSTNPDVGSASTVDLTGGLVVTVVASMATANAGNTLRLVRGVVSQVA